MRARNKDFEPSATATVGKQAQDGAKSVYLINTLIFDRTIDFTAFHTTAFLPLLEKGCYFMSHYKTKKTDYGYKQKVAVYSNPIRYGNKNPAPANGRQKYDDMSRIKQMISDDRRIRYYKQRIAELIEIAMMNPDLVTFVTLTFKEPVTSYDIALAEWQSFLKRLRHHNKDTPLKYICVWEYQKKRSQKAGIETGGIFHFHAIMNTGFIEHSELERLWGNGFVLINRINDGNGREKAIRYTVKYCIKEISERIEKGEDIRGQRFFFTSNNLLKPTVTTTGETVSIEDEIFEHMENIIRDGSYDIKNIREELINHVDYVEYKK